MADGPYLSRIRLNPTRRGTRRLLASPQRMHAVVMGSHAGLADGERVLWRLDQPSNHDLQLYVVSQTKPDFTGLVEQAGWPTTETWDSTYYGDFLNRLQRGQTWRFRLTANPVKSASALRGEGSTRGKVVPHVTAAQQEQWLLTRSLRWGFNIAGAEGEPSVTVSDRTTDVFGRSEQGQARRTVAVTRASFVGTLEVADADLLRQSLSKGMGRAKAYGCGLMTLARV